MLDLQGLNGSLRDVAQPGSAFAWGARGRWFESSRPDFFQFKRLQMPVNSPVYGHFCFFNCQIATAGNPDLKNLNIYREQVRGQVGQFYQALK